MMLVLLYLAESGPAESGEVAESLNLKPKHASMVLLRCCDRKFASRRPYQRGRVHGYVYQLTDEGAKWVLYKASQKTNADLNDRKSTIQVANKSIHQPILVFSNVNQNQQNNKDSMSFNKTIPLLAMIQAANNARRCESSPRKSDLTFPVLVKASRERDHALYSYFTEHAKNRERLKKNHQHKTALSRESLQMIKNAVWRTVFELGIKLGIEIGAFNQLVQTQNTLDKILLRKMSGSSQSPITDARAEIKHPSSKGKQHDERFASQNAYPHSSRWPNQTQRQQAPSKSFLNTFPMPSVSTLKTMRKTPKDACPPVLLEKKASEQSDLNEEDWTDKNSWWRHL